MDKGYLGLGYYLWKLEAMSLQWNISTKISKLCLSQWNIQVKNLFFFNLLQSLKRNYFLLLFKWVSSKLVMWLTIKSKDWNDVLPLHGYKI